MRKNFCALGLLLTATFSFAGVSARADDSVNTQITNQSAAAVGNGNYLYQQSDQLSIQQLKSREGGSAGSQDNLQRVDQAAAAVGDRNLVEQRNSQINVQQHEHRRQRTFDYYSR